LCWRQSLLGKSGRLWRAVWALRQALRRARPERRQALPWVRRQGLPAQQPVQRERRRVRPAPRQVVVWARQAAQRQAVAGRAPEAAPAAVAAAAAQAQVRAVEAVAAPVPVLVLVAAVVLQAPSAAGHRRPLASRTWAVGYRRAWKHGLRGCP
jgi:hypothetical protein